MLRRSKAPTSCYGKHHTRSDSCIASPHPNDFKVVPTRPRILYAIAFSSIVASLAVRAALWKYPLFHVADGVLGLVTALFVGYNILQHLKGNTTQDKVFESADVQDLQHCLVVLHANEPEHMLYNIVEQLAKQQARGAKVLLLAMEANTPNQAAKIYKIKEKFGTCFLEILVSIHTLEEGEIMGTGSNHFAAQKMAAQHFKHPENVILSKFDSNVCIAGDLLQEIEMHWLQSDVKSRAGLTFIPRICWSMTTKDSKRCAAELTVSLLGNPFLCMAPYAMSFVSGSLYGACQVGYTPPSLLPEDELLWTKKSLLLDNAQSVRLSAIVLKTFEEREISSVNFIRNMYLSKIKRWIVGWVETQDYLLRWAANAIDGHPSLDLRRVVKVISRNVFQWYLFFLMPFNIFLSLGLGAPDCNNLILQVFTYTLMFVLIGLVQLHLYQSFQFLGFDWRTLPKVVIGSQILYPILPCYMLWTFMRQCVLDEAIGHTMGPASKKETPSRMELPSISKKKETTSKIDLLCEPLSVNGQGVCNLTQERLSKSRSNSVETLSSQGSSTTDNDVETLSSQGSSNSTPRNTKPKGLLGGVSLVQALDLL